MRTPHSNLRGNVSARSQLQHAAEIERLRANGWRIVDGVVRGAPSTDNMTVTTMTADEARREVDAINTAAHDIGVRLLRIRENGGHIALGFKSWTAFLESDLFHFSRKHLYELMNAAPVQERLSPLGYKLSTDAANALAKYPVEMQPVIAQTAASRYDGRITESTVNRVGEVVFALATTGAVESREGAVTPIDAALDLQDDEARKRQLQRMNNDYTWLFTSEALVASISGGMVTFALPAETAAQLVAHTSDGLRITVSVRAMSPA